MNSTMHVVTERQFEGRGQTPTTPHTQPSRFHSDVKFAGEA